MNLISVSNSTMNNYFYLRILACFLHLHLSSRKPRKNLTSYCSETLLSLMHSHPWWISLPSIPIFKIVDLNLPNAVTFQYSSHGVVAPKHKVSLLHTVLLLLWIIVYIDDLRWWPLWKCHLTSQRVETHRLKSTIFWIPTLRLQRRLLLINMNPWLGSNNRFGDPICNGR